MKRSLSVLLGLLLVSPSFALAQDLPSIEVRSAVGLSHYLHGDLGYTTPAFIVGLRLGRGSFAVEPEFSLAQHETRQTFTAPGLGFQPVTTISTDRFRSAGVNVLGRWGSNVSGYVGGGPGFYWEPDTYTVEAASGGYEQDRSRGPRLGAQMVAGLDIPIVPRVKAFGQFRYEVRSFEDPGGGSVVQGFAGVGIRLK